MKPNVNPFPRSLPLSVLRSAHPPSHDLANALQASSSLDFERLADLWMTEGIPFAFRDHPDLYQIVRSWFSARFGIEKKDVTLIGSGRFGYKVAEIPGFGQPFSNKSDLDLTVISAPLYAKLDREASQWIQDYTSGAVKPSNEREGRYWDRNKVEIPTQLGRGFIHYNRVPTLNRYPSFQELRQSLYLLREKLAVTNGGLHITGATARIYKHWGSFIDQTKLNLATIASSIKKSAATQA